MENETQSVPFYELSLHCVHNCEWPFVTCAPLLDPHKYYSAFMVAGGRICVYPIRCIRAYRGLFVYDTPK